MFGKKKIDLIASKLETLINKFNEFLTKDAGIIEGLRRENQSLKHDFDGLKKEISLIEVNTEKRLVQFHKEITDKYFSTLQDIFRASKEISLIDSLAKSIDDKELAKLKISLMQPLIDARRLETNKQKATQAEENLKSKGALLLEERNALHERYLVLNREKKDTLFIEGQLKVLNAIIGDKNEKKD